MAQDREILLAKTTMLCCQPELKNLPFDHLCYSKKIPRSIDWSKMLKSRHN